MTRWAKAWRAAWEGGLALGVCALVLGLLLFWPVVPVLAGVGIVVVRWRLARSRRRGAVALFACGVCRCDLGWSRDRCPGCGSLIEWR